MYGRLFILCGISAGEIGIVQSFGTADFNKLRTIPAIASQKRNIQPQFTCLFNDFSNFFIIPGNIDCFRISGFDFRQGRFKIKVFSKKSFFSDDLAAFFFHSFSKYFSYAFGIITGSIIQNRYIFYFQVFISKFCHNTSLEGIDKAGTEHKFFYFSIFDSNVRRSCTRCNQRHFISSSDRCGSSYTTAGCRSDNSYYLILSDEFGNRVTCFRRFRLVIAFHDTQFFTINTAGFIYFIKSHF